MYYALDTWTDVYKTSVGKAERKRQFATPRCRDGMTKWKGILKNIVQGHELHSSALG